MIPRRIALSGFLCYRDEQVIDFEGCDLWVLSGRNGSGKSAIFDAMTFALFGAHRGGKKEVARLLNTEADEFSVVFDFDLRSERYRIRRSLRNGTSERQVYHFEAEDGGSGRWPAVPETSTDGGLKRWVQENLGLSYEAFTASVLLMQGKAENLLVSSPKERFEILAGIVDLASYQRLHKLADDRRKDLVIKLDFKHSQLRALPEVAPEALAAAEAHFDESGRVFTEAEAEWKSLIAIEYQSRDWQSLVARRVEAHQRLDRASQLIADSETIARDWERLKDLSAVLPVLRESIGRREAIRLARSEAHRLETERADLDRKRDLSATLAEDTRQHLASIVEEIERDERRRQAIQERRTELTPSILRSELARKQRAQIDRLEQELSAHMEDLDAEVVRLEHEYHRCVGWSTALPTLKFLANSRAGLAKARQASESARKATDEGEETLQGLREEMEARRLEEETARRAFDEARDRLTEAATLRREAGARLDRFDGLSGASSCDRCGQALSPEHYELESRRLHDQLDEATLGLEEADRALGSAKGRLANATASRADAEQAVRGTESTVEKAKQELSLALQKIGEHQDHCRDAYESLVEPFRSSVAPSPPADWLATTFPGREDLADGGRQAAEVGTISTQLDAARARRDSKRDARIRLSQAQQSLLSIGLEPGDDQAELEHRALSVEGEALARCLRGHATQRSLAQTTLASLQERAESWAQERLDCEGRLLAKGFEIQSKEEETARARASFAEPWHVVFETVTEADLPPYEAEIESLRGRGTELLAAEWPHAQARLEQARSELDALDLQIAEIPPAARREPNEAARLRAEAEARRDRLADGRDKARKDLEVLRRDRDQRQILDRDVRETDGALAVARKLAEYLGREGLQRTLLRRAERGILDCANPILRELSGGELELRLAEGEEDPEAVLTLEALVRTHGRTCAHDVAYLSGSQRFRVAVSLALGIGQFARGIHGPIESVIIDEGFGCLDRQGRDEMIEELKGLRSKQLAKIILVSHQEEFTDAFNDGYRFEVVDGATVVQPFHR